MEEYELVYMLTEYDVCFDLIVNYKIKAKNEEEALKIAKNIEGEIYKFIDIKYVDALKIEIKKNNLISKAFTEGYKQFKNNNLAYNKKFKENLYRLNPINEVVPVEITEEQFNNIMRKHKNGERFSCISYGVKKV